MIKLTPFFHKSIDTKAIAKAVDCLKKGGVIAYPTEAVYGLGCDPSNVNAVSHLLQIKHRTMEKGFILVASSWAQVESYIEPIQPPLLARVLETWPGPYTWIFPAKTFVPKWIRGKHQTIAVRVSNHPIVQILCKTFGEPIISTSANVEGQPPARDYRTVKMSLGNKLDYIVKGDVGKLLRPTEIRNAITGEILRSGS